MQHLSFSAERVFLGISALSLFILPFFPGHPLAHSAALIFLFLFNGFLIGTRWFSSHARWSHPFFGALLLVTSSSLFQTIWYYASQPLGPRSDCWSLGLSILVLSLLPVPSLPTKNTEEEETLKTPPSKWAALWIPPLLIAAEIALCFILLQAWRAQTTNAINTPWTLLPAGTLAAFSLLAASIWLCAWKIRDARLTALLVCSLLASLTLSVCFIYPLGFGFDGFLHRASEQLLLTTGTLSPKPPYYIGQYVFVTWLSRIFDISLFSIDRFLVPLSVLLIPLSFLARPSKTRISLALAGLVVFLPFSLFITSTPQSFSYVIGLSALIFSLAYFEERVPRIFPLLLGCWSVFIHPLSGLPLFGAVLTILWVARKKDPETTIRSPIWWFLLLGTSFSTPLAFFLNGLISDNAVSWDMRALGQVSFYLETLRGWFVVPALHFSLLVDWTDFWHFLLPFISFILAVWAVWRDTERRPVWISLLFIAIGVCLSGIFLRASGEFGFLINYERGNYADRLFILASLILLPVTLQGFVLWTERMRRRSTSVLLSVFVIFLAAVSARVYNALPRHDVAIVGRGWSVGQADLDAVRFIEKDAQGRVYTVLANQSVSAAGVSQFGFKRYADQIFYYPIPTGGPLYRVFLDAMNQPDRGVVREASVLGKSELVYVVVNSYWNNAEKIADAYQSLADKSWSAYNGKIYVFRFEFKASSNPIK